MRGARRDRDRARPRPGDDRLLGDRRLGGDAAGRAFEQAVPRPRWVTAEHAARRGRRGPRRRARGHPRVCRSAPPCWPRATSPTRSSCRRSSGSAPERRCSVGRARHPPLGRILGRVARKRAGPTERHSRSVGCQWRESRAERDGPRTGIRLSGERRTELHEPDSACEASVGPDPGRDRSSERGATPSGRDGTASRTALAVETRPQGRRRRRPQPATPAGRSAARAEPPRRGCAPAACGTARWCAP